MEESEKNACVDLLIKNMKALYEKSNWGWSEKNKRSEMMEEAAWYLLAKNEEGKICGFSHFRYDMDCDDEVLYVYEVSTYYLLWLRLNYCTPKIGWYIKIFMSVLSKQSAVPPIKL